ncbi:MAG: STT3 domain-containing protein [Nanoarchaeota archaeon]
MEQKEDEDISIDFSKIKKFFAKEEKEEAKIEDTPKQEEKKESDELSIDVSKIKDFFKSHTPSDAEAEGHHPAKKDDDSIDMSFDFSKIKKFFKSEKGISSTDEELSLNWSKIAEFFKKYGIIFIALIPVILAIYVRMQAGFLLFTDDWARDSVINIIRTDLRADINQRFPNLPDSNKNFQLNTELAKSIKSGKYVFKTGQYAGQEMEISNQLRQTSQFFKAFYQDEKQEKYMPDIDPYYWSRYAKNIIERGHPGDTLKEGKPVPGGGSIKKPTPFDTLQLAPVGRFVLDDMFHPYSLAYFYKILNFFVPDLSLMRSMFYHTVFFSALCVLLVFLIARKIAGNLGGFFAGLIMAVNAAFLGRSLHPDNDVWVIFFPLVITWVFLISISAKTTLKVGILTIIAGFFTGLYTTAWSGWWYIFDFLLGTIALTSLYIVFSKFGKIKNDIRLFFSDGVLRNIIIFGVVYFFSTAAFAILFSGWFDFKNSFLGPLSFQSIKAPVTPYIWPNVLTTVAELNEGAIDEIVNSMGGPSLFFISLLGLILSISRIEGLQKFDFTYILVTAVFYSILFIRVGAQRPALYKTIGVFTFIAWIVIPILLRILIAMYRKDPSYDFKLSILLSLWVISTVFASIKGIRFTLLLAPAFSVAFGVALGKTYLYATKLATRELRIHKVIGSSILIVLMLLVYINPIRGAISNARNDIPIVNDAWYNTLISIKQNSKENAIITSWWDFGHHFKAIAERPVTFDGTTQTDAAAHWVGRLFMTDSEKEAFGIIRMLDCGHNNATVVLSRINNDLIKSLKIVKEIIELDKKEASKRLAGYGLAPQQVEEVVANTHCSPPEAFLIASNDMSTSRQDMDGGKSGVWSHFGSWNFERADIWFNAKKMQKEQGIEYMMNKFNYTREKAESIYFEIQSISNDRDANSWVAPWPGYGGTMGCSKNDAGLYVCNNGLQINLSNYDVFGIGQKGIVRPKVAAFTTKESMIKKEFNGDTLDFGLTIIPRNDMLLEAVISSKELTGSMFIRMYKMQGHGLKYFKLFKHETGLTGTNIYIYKVDWEGKNETIVQEYVDYLRKFKEVESLTNISKEYVPTIFNIGDEIVAGDFKWKFSNFTKKSQIGDYISREADGEFLILDVEVENIGTSAQLLKNSLIELIDNQGREFSADIKYYDVKPEAIIFDTINPGIVKKGKIVFDIPKGLTNLKIKVISNRDNIFNYIKIQ